MVGNAYQNIKSKILIPFEQRQCGIFTSVDSDEPVQSPFKLRNSKLEHPVDGAPSQIPTLKLLTPPPITQESHPGAWPWQQNENSVQYVFYLLFVRTHTKIFEIDILIFDLLTSPQGHQFDPRMKMLLAFCSACHPRRFDMPHDHVSKKKKKNWPPGHPSAPKSHPWGITQATE